MKQSSYVVFVAKEPDQDGFWKVIVRLHKPRYMYKILYFETQTNLKEKQIIIIGNEENKNEKT